MSAEHISLLLQAVTKKQAKERADMRKAQNQPLIEPFVKNSKKRKAVVNIGAEAENKKSGKPKRPPLKRAFLPVSLDD